MHTSIHLSIQPPTTQCTCIHSSARAPTVGTRQAVQWLMLITVNSTDVILHHFSLTCVFLSLPAILSSHHPSSIRVNQDLASSQQEVIERGRSNGHYCGNTTNLLIQSTISIKKPRMALKRNSMLICYSTFICFIYRKAAKYVSWSQDIRP